MAVPGWLLEALDATEWGCGTAVPSTREAA